ncbi:hypothetical protein ACH4OY_26830 [Micromonospora rubida]|uniref:RHS repeat-associated core domain-containing protein n=1 Tax=Micromonospora rubida TaxID=2697657 RepID=A0ABW7ST49_9ACTN
MPDNKPRRRLQRRHFPEGRDPDREGPVWRRDREAYEVRAQKEAKNQAEFQNREQKKTHALGEMKQGMKETGGTALERFRREYAAWRERSGKSYTPEELARAEAKFSKRVEQLWQTKFTNTDRVRGGRFDIFYRRWPTKVDNLAKNFRFDYYADLYQAQARAGKAFDDARMDFERPQPGSGRTAGEFAESKAQYVGLVTRTYRINYQADFTARADGSYQTWKPQADRSFDAWQKQLEKGLPGRFGKEIELDTFMKGRFPERLDQWKQARGLDDGPLPWEGKVAEDFRTEQRLHLTEGPSPHERSSARSEQPGGDRHWQDTAADALPDRFDRAHAAETRRLAAERDMNSFHTLEDGSPFDQALAGLPPEKAALLDKPTIARERAAFLTRSREAYLDARAGENPGDAVPKWLEGRALAEKLAADKLALAIQREQLMADVKQRQVEQDWQLNLSEDALVRVRAAFEQDLQKAYQDVWGDHPGAFAKGPGDENLKSIWSRWEFRTQDLSGRLDVHMLHEDRLHTVLDIAARDFEIVFGPADPPSLAGLGLVTKARYDIPYAERVAIADEFRHQYVSNYHKTFGRPGESVDGWLAHEKMSTNQFERTTEGLSFLRELQDMARLRQHDDGPNTFPLNEGWKMELHEWGVWVRPAEVPSDVAALVRSGHYADKTSTDPDFVVGSPHTEIPPSVLTQGREIFARLPLKQDGYGVTLLSRSHAEPPPAAAHSASDAGRFTEVDSTDLGVTVRTPGMDQAAGGGSPRAGGDSGTGTSRDVLAGDRYEYGSSGRIIRTRNEGLGDTVWEHHGDNFIWHEPWGKSAFHDGVMIRRTTSDGNELTKFDSRGRPTEGVGPDGRRFVLLYERTGDRHGQLHYQDGDVPFELDGRRRLSAGIDAGGRKFTVTYDDQQGVSSRRYEDGSVEKMEAPEVRFDPEVLFAKRPSADVAERLWAQAQAEGPSAPEASASAGVRTGGPSDGGAGSRPDVSVQGHGDLPAVVPEGGPVGGGSRRGQPSPVGTGSGADGAVEVPPVRDGSDVIPPSRLDGPASGAGTGGRSYGRTGAPTLVAERPPPDDVVARMVAARPPADDVVARMVAEPQALGVDSPEVSSAAVRADGALEGEGGAGSRGAMEEFDSSGRIVRTRYEGLGDKEWEYHGADFVWHEPWGKSAIRAGAMVLRTTSDGSVLTTFDNAGRPTAGVAPGGRRFVLSYERDGDHEGRLEYADGVITARLDGRLRLLDGMEADGRTFTVAYDDQLGVSHRLYEDGSAEEMTAPALRFDPEVVFAGRPLTGDAMAELLLARARADGLIAPRAPSSAPFGGNRPAVVPENGPVGGGSRGGQSSSPGTGPGSGAAVEVPPVSDGSVISPSRLDGPAVGADTSGWTGSRDVVAKRPLVDAPRNPLRSPLANVGSPPRPHVPAAAPSGPRVPTAVERAGDEAVRRMLVAVPPPAAVLPPGSGPGHLARPLSVPGPALAPLPRPAPPMPRIGSDYFAGPLDGLAATASGRAVLLHEGRAPTLPAADRPRGSRAGLTVVLDLEGQRLAQVPAALRQLRPEFRSRLTLQFAGRWPSLSPEQAESMANELLGDLHPTAALQVPADELADRPAPTPWVVPVDANGNATFAATAAAFRFHAGNDLQAGDHVSAPRTRTPYGLTPGPWHGTYELTPGWYLDARDSDRLWVGRHLPETVVPRGGGADETVPIVVGEPGELVPDEVLAQLGRIRTATVPTEMVLVGRALTGGQRQQLGQVRAVLPDGWQAHPVPAGWVVAAAGAVAPADPGVAATRASYPGSRVLFVDPAGADAAAVARSVADLVAALPGSLRDRVVVQPVPGAAVPWQAFAELSGMLPTRATGVPALVVPVARLAEAPPASASGFVPMTWGPAGPVRTLPHFADHYRVYGPGATPGEPLPAGLSAGDGDGRFGIELPGLRDWVVDTTYPGMVHIRPGGVALPPPPPIAASTARPDAVRISVSGAPNQSQRAGLFTVLEGLRAGRPLDVNLAGEPDGLRALENAAVRESLPPGFIAHQLPAGHLVVRGTETPAELDGARDVPPVPDVTLIQVGGGVPVGAILGSLPSGVRDRAVLRRSDDPPLPPAWVPLYLRRRQWPAERVEDRGERSRLINNERLTALQTATTRTWVEQAVGRATVAPVVAASSKALRLANLGHQELAEHHLAAVHVESGTDQLTSLLRGAGFALPPPVSLGGGAGASQSQHANAAMLEAIRLFLSDRPDRAYEVILRNRSALVGRQRIDWVRWLGELRDALPDRREGIGTLADHVMTC